MLRWGPALPRFARERHRRSTRSRPDSSCIDNADAHWFCKRKNGVQVPRSVVGRCSAALVVLHLRVRELPAGGENLAFTSGGVELGGRFPVAVDGDGELLLTGLDGVGHVVDDLDVVALLDLLVGFFVDFERDDAEVEQVRLVDTGEALCADGLDTQIHRTEGRVFARGALAVVLAGDEDATGRV